MERERTRGEINLLDVEESLTGLSEKERCKRLAGAVNDVLREAVRDGYQLDYSPTDGVHLHTPGGLWLWFCATVGSEVTITVLVTDEVLGGT